MSATLTAILSDLRHRRLQAVIIAFVVLLASGAGTLALSLALESDAPYEHAFAQANGAHLILTYDARRVGADMLRATARRPGVTAVEGPWPQVVAMYSSGSPDLGPSVGGYLFVVGRARPDTAVDRLTIESGRWAARTGEVVVSRQLADGWGLSVGGTLTPDAGSHIPSLQIVGIAGSISPYTDAWVLPGQISAMVAPSSPLQYQMLYRVTSARTATDLQRATRSITQGFPAGSVAATNNYLDVKLNADLLSSVMVPFLLAFSAFALLASVMIISNVVSGVVIAGYRDIGIMKAVGFTPGGVMAVLLGLVLIPGLAGGLVGILLGTAASQPFLQQTAHALNLPAPFTAAIPVDLAVLATVLIVATVAAAIPAWRAGHLSPVAAVTAGTAPSARHSAGLDALLSRLPLPRVATLGLGDTLARPLRTGMTTGAILIGAATVVFALSLHLSLGQVAAHLIRSDYVQIQIDRPPPGGGAGVKGPIAGSLPTMSDRQVTHLVQSDPQTARFVAETQEQIAVAGIAARIPYYAYRGDSSWIGFAIISGRWFSHPGEVVAPTKLMREANLHIGESFTAIMHGRVVRLRLVGEILDQSNDDLLLRGTWATLHAADPGAQPYSYEVQVRPGVNPDTYRQGIGNRISTTGPIPLSVNTTAQSSRNSDFILLNGVIAGLALVLIIIAVAGVFNTVVLTTREKVRDVAILKAIGMAPGQVVSMIVISVAMLGLLGGVLGVPVGLLLHAQVLTLMAQAASNTNLPPSFFHLIGRPTLALLALAGVAIAAIGAWVPAQWAASSGVADVLQTE